MTESEQVLRQHRATMIELGRSIPNSGLSAIAEKLEIGAVRSAAASASEEASGAGLVNFAVLVTATVIDPAKLPEARAAVDNLSAASRLRIRPTYGSQDSAFAMALPLGLVPKKHSQVPSEFRDSL